MKPVIYLFFVLIFCFSCKKDDAFEKYYGTANCLKDGQKYTMRTHAFVDSTVHIEMNTYDKDKLLASTFICGKFPSKVGNHIDLIKEKGECKANYFKMYYDEVLDTYNFEKDSSNYFYLDKIDKEKKIISGRFSVKLKNDKGNILSLTNGVFEAPF